MIWNEEKYNPKITCPVKSNYDKIWVYRYGEIIINGLFKKDFEYKKYTGKEEFQMQIKFDEGSYQKDLSKYKKSKQLLFEQYLQDLYDKYRSIEYPFDKATSDKLYYFCSNYQDYMEDKEGMFDDLICSIKR